MRILIAIHDLSLIENILQFAAQIACSANEPPTILAAIGYGADRPPPLLDTILAEACKRVPMPALQTQIRIGDPVENILREAEDGNYDLVIVGDRSNHRLGRLFRASIAIRIAERAPCPVIVVKGKTGPIQRILMCDSGSEGSPLLGRFTAQLADLLPGEEEVTILHVMSQISAGPGVRGGQLRNGADKLIEEHTPEGELLERDIQTLERPRVHPIPKVRHGLVVDEILAEARSGDYDLVVIGAYLSEGWGRFLLDDLAHKILTQMDRSVLVVR
ncbi:MAG: universal stress protein [Anaerolineales bacterium]|nr:universal stress protein [Anaerolineales bacterium]